MQGFAGFTEPGVGQGVLFIVTWYPVSGWLTGSPMSSFPFYRLGNRLREQGDLPSTAETMRTCLQSFGGGTQTMMPWEGLGLD